MMLQVISAIRTLIRATSHTKLLAMIQIHATSISNTVLKLNK